MIKKEVFIGFLVGLIANITGFIIALSVLAAYSKLTLKTSLEVAVEQDTTGSLIALGASLNILAFFLFIRLKRDYRARGVLMATVFAAIAILISKFM